MHRNGMRRVDRYQPMLAGLVTKVAISLKAKEAAKRIDEISVQQGKRRPGNDCSGGKKTKRLHYF